MGLMIPLIVIDKTNPNIEFKEGNFCVREMCHFAAQY